MAHTLPFSETLTSYAYNVRRQKARAFYTRVTLVLSSKSLVFKSAWLILKTIQSNRALYNDFAMEFRTVTAWKIKQK